jgi:sugar fermentation stimulation protein A
VILPELHRGRIHRRYKRFLADVELDDGRMVTAHCPNTGSMAGCWAPLAPVELSHSADPKRKLAWTLERVDMGAGWVGVHTGRTNPVIAEAIEHGRIARLAGYRELRREVEYTPAGHPRSRLDIMLNDSASDPDAYVEIKNTTLLDGDLVRFPDAVTERGRKHLDVLAEAVAGGRRGVIVFAVNRPEGERFAPAWSIDPGYAERLCEVAEHGVEVLAVRIRHTATGMEVTGTLDLDLRA